jgi:hypothetical protein
MIPDPAPPFEVAMSDALREHVDHLIDRAAVRGMGQLVRRNVRDLLSILRIEPRRQGDPLRHLQGMTSTLYRLVRHQLIAHYTVHDRIPMVTVWQFEFAPSHPLAPPGSNGH